MLTPGGRAGVGGVFDCGGVFMGFLMMVFCCGFGEIFGCILLGRTKVCCLGG